MAEKTKKELIEDIEHVMALLGGMRKSAANQAYNARQRKDEDEERYHDGRYSIAHTIFNKLERALKGAK